MSSDHDEPLLARLYAEAMASPPPRRQERAVELCRAHPELLTDLQALIGASSTASGWLDDLALRLLPEAGKVFGTASSELPAGTRIGPWRIDGVAGAGGMGVVYKARDVELERWVALKFIPPHTGSDGHGGLLEEARAASALDHPNVGVVYQVGVAGEDTPAGGQAFIAGAYYEGETVGQRLEQGPLPLLLAVEWTLEIARALEYAHDQGVVHGDIKGHNVMVTDRGEVKVLDFGVASVSGRPAHPGGAGTPAVMSPEQTLGRPLDGRSDIWSLGVLLYEMLTGRRPFSGTDVHDVLRAVREDPIADITSLVPGVPATVTRIVGTCLERDPRRRYPDAGALIAELRIARSGIVASSTHTSEARRGVVVLPFVNGSPDRNTDYVADGLTDEVVLALSRVSGLRVISRSSVMRLRGRADPVDELADALGVRWVVEGVVRKAGNRIRVTTHLLDSRTGAHIWVERFDGDAREAFAVQERVAEALLERLSVQVSPEERRRLARRSIAHPGAYDAYLRARHEAWRFSGDGLRRARHYIDTALQIVGENVLLYSTLGHVLAMSHEAGIDPGPDTLARVDELADRVATLAPDEPRGHWLRGFVAFQRGDLATALRAGEMACVADPGDPDSLVLLGYLYTHVSRNDEARSLFLRALDVDPLTPLTRCMPGMADLMDGRYHAAVEAYHSALELDPASPFSVFMYGWVLAQAGRYTEATAVMEQTARDFGDTVFGAIAGSLHAALTDDRERARSLLAPLTTVGEGSEMFARLLCHAHTLAGDHPGGLRWLRRAVEMGMLNRPFLGQHDRLLDPLRSEPEFEAIMNEVDRRLDALT